MIQKGSKVEAIFSISGELYVESVLSPIMHPISEGRILTVRGFGYGMNNNGTQSVGLVFEEIPPIYHPVLNVECAYAIGRFREIEEDTSFIICHIEECKTETV